MVQVCLEDVADSDSRFRRFSDPNADLPEIADRVVRSNDTRLVCGKSVTPTFDGIARENDLGPRQPPDCKLRCPATLSQRWTLELVVHDSDNALGADSGYATSGDRVVREVNL